MPEIIKANIELHAHPFLGNTTLEDVIMSMKKNKLDVVALEEYNSSNYSQIVKESKGMYSSVIDDDKGVLFMNHKCIFNAGEYDTKEKLHVLTVGCSIENYSQQEIKKVIDSALEKDALVLLDHIFVDNEKTRTAGHISEEKAKLVEKICKEYSGNVALEWNAYCIPWMRAVLQKGLNAVGKKTDYYDVNKRAEELSEKLKEEGYNVPIIADTDLHGRSKRLMDTIGTSRIITDIEGETPNELLNSIKKNVFSGNYKNIKQYVSSAHLLEAFCFPILFPNYFWKPRG